MRPAPTARRPAATVANSVASIAVAYTLLALLGVLLIPAVQKARDTAARTTTLNNFKTLGMAMHGYCAQHGKLPAAMMQGPGQTIAGSPLRAAGKFFGDDPGVLVAPLDWSFQGDQSAWTARDKVYCSFACNYYLFGTPDGIAVASGYKPGSVNHLFAGSSSVAMFTSLHATCPVSAEKPTTHIDAGPTAPAGPFFGQPNDIGWAIPTRRTPCGPDNGGDANGRAAAYTVVGIQVGLADGGARSFSFPGYAPSFWGSLVDPSGGVDPPE